MFDIFWNIISAIIAVVVGGYVWVCMWSVDFNGNTNKPFPIFVISLVSAVVSYYCWFAAFIIFVGFLVIRWVMHFFMESIEFIHYVYFAPKYVPKYNRHNHIR